VFRGQLDGNHHAPMTTTTDKPTVDAATAERWRALWADELRGAALYRALAAAADDRRASILTSLAEAEERHAEHWATLLRDHGLEPGDPPSIDARGRLLAWAARRFGLDSVLPIVLRFEAGDAERYRRARDASPAMAHQELVHERVLAAIAGDDPGERIARAEGRHRTATAGALRAAVFGVNDGLVSNLALVMGMRGGTADDGMVALAGLAGLLAGACSMAAGEWVSMRSQRDLYEHELAVEREELARFPEEEREELALIYQAKGLEPAEAEALADRLTSEPDTALDTLAREELGLDPNELGSPLTAACASFISFAAGAVIPVAPYLVVDGTTALAVAVIAAVLAAAIVGAAVAALTSRGLGRGALRMILAAAAAAAVSFGAGHLVGGAVG
jgi:VIT1/CCC1 family predicted Fe2+/Mn2+ transporter